VFVERRVTLEPEYWTRKSLEQLSHAEWEALCDGCGRCCLLKLEDEDDGAVVYTRIACRLFDAERCRCASYAQRARLVPGCVTLTPESIRDSARWMPTTCAYRLVAEGRPLPDWHPLVSGDPETVHHAGVSMRAQTVPEFDVLEEDFEDHLIDHVTCEAEPERASA
jgi:uncharacterized cysteine cluster protein YcgN (CxxCxxCC family)